MTGDFRGIYPILYAFFDDSDRLDRVAMRRQVEACIRHGAHGIAILGLATEVGKLSLAERRQLVDWAAEDIAGRVPLAVTVAEPSVGAQVDFDSDLVDSYGPFGRAFDLFGDGSVHLAYTPGHTLGHMSVVLRTRDREFLIAADAAYTMRTLRESVMPYGAHDEHEYRRSLKEVQRYIEQTPNAVVSSSTNLRALTITRDSSEPTAALYDSTALSRLRPSFMERFARMHDVVEI